MMVFYVHHAGIFGDVVVVAAGGATTARCACGVNNSARDAWEIEAWALTHENYLHTVDIDAVISRPDGLAIGRAFFGLVRSTERGRSAFEGAMSKTMLGPDMAEEILVWCEQQLITGPSRYDEEWLAWLGTFADRRLVKQTVAAE